MSRNNSEINAFLSQTREVRFFNPKYDISRDTPIVAWWDATDLNTIATNFAYNQVQNWTSKEGNNLVLTQATNGSQPLINFSGGQNGFPYITFSGSRNLLLSGFALNYPMTAVIIIRQNAITNNDALVNMGANMGWTQTVNTFSAHSYQALAFGIGGSFGFIKQLGSYQNNFIMHFANARTTAFNDMGLTTDINNTPPYIDQTSGAGGLLASTATQTTQFKVGGTAAMNFDVHEIMIFSGSLSIHDEKKVKEYMMFKYALPKPDCITVYGDSISLGLNATDRMTGGYVGLAAFDKGKPMVNYAVAGATVFNTGTAGRNLVNQLAKFSDFNTDGWFVLNYGTNTEINTVTSSVWCTVYQYFIQQLINKGVSASKIILCVPPYNSTNTWLPTVRTAILSTIAPALLAAKNPVNVCDFYADFQTAGYDLGASGNAAYSDGTHPNDTGHQRMRDLLKTFIN